tara:strand:- start:1392 stop:1778 length:387 start_codon:yes stop_codon:yes gene_type:complete
MRKICLIFIYLFFQKYDPIYSKDHKNFVYTCADENGPVLEFSIPNFENNEIKKEISFKFFRKNNKDEFLSNGIIEKKNSPIDYSYTFFLIKIPNNQKNTDITQIEFFPPSHMIVTKNKSSSESLVCWH